MRRFVPMLCVITFLAQCTLPVSKTKAPYLSYGAGIGEGSVGVHTVTQGETLWNIAQRYRLPLRDIMNINDLEPPYRLSSGMRLKLPPPREYKTQQGDSLRSVAQIFSVSPKEIVAINHLAPPYALRPGQVLRLPSVLGDVGQMQAENNNNIGESNQNINDFSVTAPGPQAVEIVPLSDSPATASPSAKPVDVAALPPQPKSVESPVDLRVSTPDPVRAPSQAAKEVGATKPILIKNIPALAGQFIKPVQGQIISSFGSKAGGLHNDGINIRAARGTAVRASENGVIAYVGSEIEGFGNLVLIKHQDRYVSAYAHLDKPLVKRGDKVSRGQTIGTVGSTGNVESPQLHFEIRKGRDPINPQGLLGA